MRLGSEKSARRRLLAGLLAVSLTAAACGGASSSDSSNGDDGDGGASETLEDRGLTAAAGESGLDEAGEPVRGGKLIYGVEADSNSFCLSEGQLAISGMLVVRAVYDTLTIPNAEGEYVPYLAKAVTPNDAYDEWTIELREGIEFHDGSPLDAEVVKNNIDAYRGKYPGRSSLLFMFVLNNIDTVEAVDDLTVKVTTKVPWVAFPSFLHSSSRFGIMAQAQLDDPDCSKNPIGTGPFKFKSWNENEKLEAERNPDYWQIAPDGEPYPYVDAIEFRIVPDGQQRQQAMLAGDLNIMHTASARRIADDWYKARENGEVNLFVSEDWAEVGFIQLNNTKPPFDDIRMRQAMAMAADREDINELLNDGVPTLANGPISEGSLGYTDGEGFPDYDIDEARRLVEEYVAEGGKAEFVLSATSDPDVRRMVQIVQDRAKDVGVEVKIATRDQAALINDAIARDYQAMTFRNYPGGDPDALYVWFHSGGVNAEGKPSNPVNFAGVADEVIDESLETGRSETDPEKRRAAYETLNDRMASEVFNIWMSFTPWAIVVDSEIHGILGPALPGEDISEEIPMSIDDASRQPNRGLATGHSLLGLWIAD